MRIKVILAALVLALAVLGPAAWYRYGSSSPAPAQPPAATASISTQPGAPSLVRAGSRRSRSAEPEFPRERRPADLSTPSQDDSISQRTAQLNQLAFSGEPRALRTILAELTNQDPAIRKAALRAAIDFGSQDAIPDLQNAIAWLDDPQEKVALQKAIDFLQLPKFNPDSPPVAGAAPLH
jgi:hypothetical protein